MRVSLAGVWEDAGFRSAVRGLLLLSDDVLDQVAQIAAMGPAAGSKAALEQGVDSDDEVHAIAVLSFLLQQQQRQSIDTESLISELEERVAESGEEFSDVDFGARKDRLAAILKNPEYVRKQQYNVVQHQIFPTLQRVAGAIDLRVDERGDEGPRVVPVVILRLEFDEAVNGSRAISFQLSDESVALLENELEELKSLRHSTMTRFSNELW